MKAWKDFSSLCQFATRVRLRYLHYKLLTCILLFVRYCCPLIKYLAQFASKHILLETFYTYTTGYYHTFKNCLGWLSFSGQEKKQYSYVDDVVILSGRRKSYTRKYEKMNDDFQRSAADIKRKTPWWLRLILY